MTSLECQLKGETAQLWPDLYWFCDSGAHGQHERG